MFFLFCRIKTASRWPDPAIIVRNIRTVRTGSCVDRRKDCTGLPANAPLLRSDPVSVVSITSSQPAPASRFKPATMTRLDDGYDREAGLAKQSAGER